MLPLICLWYEFNNSFIVKDIREKSKKYDLVLKKNFYHIFAIGYNCLYYWSVESRSHALSGLALGTLFLENVVRW